MRTGLLFALAACGGSAATVPSTPAPAPASQAPPPAPTLRLGDSVVPTHYALDLKLVPSAATFDGTVDIDVDVKQATTGIWLNASELEVHSATVDGQTARVLPNPQGDDQHLGLGLSRAVGPGKARLHIAFTGKLQTKDTSGVFKQESGGDPYIFTQFESRDARRGFPCFDDPSFKAPWAVTLHVPEKLVAAANYPVANETPEGSGMKAVHFQETKPLPSYLVAFAVGPFDIVDGGRSKNGAPIRILALKGRGAEAAWAAESTRPILETLEDYLGSPYPFAKLDEVAIPKTVAFGAMENPGLVTYNETSLLARKDDDTVQRRHGYAFVCAHELAHMWFGDLVTLAWWNDTWLNESFANWMENIALQRWQPSWGAAIDAVGARSRAMMSDSLTTARAVRQPIKSENDIANAFDPGTTYGKGAALLHMFQAWVGPETYQKGVRQYLHDHAYGNATAEDFFAAIGKASGKDVAPVMKTFLDQAGAPLLSVELVCNGKPKLELTQRRYVLVGEEADERTWQIPICVRWEGGQTCTLMTQARATLELPTSGCPAWVMPNAGGIGYYRSAPDAKLLAGLLKNLARLTVAERVALAGDMTALVRAGALPAGQALAALPAFNPAGDRFMAAEATGLIRSVRQSMLPEALRPKLARYITHVFGAKAHELGFARKPGESDDAEELRALIVPLVALDGDDPKLVAEARRLTDKWLADHSAVAPDESADVLMIAAAHGDRALFDRLVDAAKKETDRRLRARLLGAISAFQDPKLHRAALDELYLSKDFDIRELGRLRGRGANLRTEEDVDLVFAWTTEHFDAIAEKMPKQGRAFLLRMAAGVCDEEKLRDYESFFKERADTIIGGPRTYQNVVESIRSCVAVRKLQSPSVADFLKRQG